MACENRVQVRQEEIERIVLQQHLSGIHLSQIERVLKHKNINLINILLPLLYSVRTTTWALIPPMGYFI